MTFISRTLPCLINGHDKLNTVKRWRWAPLLRTWFHMNPAVVFLFIIRCQVSFYKSLHKQWRKIDRSVNTHNIYVLPFSPPSPFPHIALSRGPLFSHWRNWCHRFSVGPGKGRGRTVRPVTRAGVFLNSYTRFRDSPVWTLHWVGWCK